MTTPAENGGAACAGEYLDFGDTLGDASLDATVVSHEVGHLLVAAQVKALLGVPPQTEAKIKTARWLVTILHGAPVRARR